MVGVCGNFDGKFYKNMLKLIAMRYCNRKRMETDGLDDAILPPSMRRSPQLIGHYHTTTDGLIESDKTYDPVADNETTKELTEIQRKGHG